MTSAPRDVAELELAELETLLEARGPSVSTPASSTAGFTGAASPISSRMTDLSRDAAQLQERVHHLDAAIVSDETSSDGTAKFVLELADGRRIESVFIPDTPSMTFCISTQVGCAMACGFCLTGKMGLVRNLTAGNRRPGARPRGRDRPPRSPVQHRADGNGRAAAQLRQTR